MFLDCLPSLCESGAERDLIQIGHKFSKVSGRERQKRAEGGREVGVGTIECH